MLKIRKIAILAIATLAFGSCQKQVQKTLTPETTQENTSTLSLRDVKIEDGMLKFENEEHLTNCRNELSKMTHEQTIEWQNTIGFKSLMSIMNDAQTEMRNIELKFPDIENNSSDYYSFLEGIKPIALKYKKYMEIDANGNITGKNWIDGNIANLSTTDNLFKVGKSIHYMDEKEIIIIGDGDVSKIEIAKNNKVTNLESNIFYSKIENVNTKQSRGGPYMGTTTFGNNTGNPSTFNTVIDWSTKTGSKCNGSTYKTTIYLRLFGALNASGTQLTHNLIIEGYNQKKNFVGGWAATYAPLTSVTGNYFTDDNGNGSIGMPKINYFTYLGFPTSYTTFPFSNSVSGQQFYNFPFGTRTVNSTTPSYKFNAYFTTTSNHHCGTISVGL